MDPTRVSSHVERISREIRIILDGNRFLHPDISRGLLGGSRMTRPPAADASCLTCSGVARCRVNRVGDATGEVLPGC